MPVFVLELEGTAVASEGWRHMAVVAAWDAVQAENRIAEVEAPHTAVEVDIVLVASQGFVRRTVVLGAVVVEAALRNLANRVRLSEFLHLSCYRQIPFDRS